MANRDYCRDCGYHLSLHATPDDCEGAKYKGELGLRLSQMMFGPFLPRRF